MLFSTGANTLASVQFSRAHFDKHLLQTPFFHSKILRKIARSYFSKITDIMTISEATSVAIRHQNMFGELSHADAYKEVFLFPLPLLMLKSTLSSALSKQGQSRRIISYNRDRLCFTAASKSGVQTAVPKGHI